ncbi:MAG: sialate O-acetylesterase [Saprospiraceae bacterium]|jgi:sialate O-acetylesterase|nr:sialate O-acetylesterase [Saprospiraceae bacterium]MDP4815799.1 sialate O-acetylesterase [Saprospiraceae bacterium]MDP4914494.1 sialate O-acetylesterase [Saprospiraceae bacterium]
MKKVIRYLVISTLLLNVTTLFAQIETPSFISDNMVLQQQTEAPIWGEAKPMSTVYINCSWDDIKYVTYASENGKWKIRVKTPKAGGPYTIKINDRVIENILIGEVWICSGQSNMEFALNSEDQITEGGAEEAEKANYPKIRLFYTARQYGDQPQDDCHGRWVECSPSTAATFSATAYYFGKYLHNELNVPIGLIHTSWGGSSAQAWVKEDVLKSDEDYAIYYEMQKRREMETEPGILPLDTDFPSVLYNAMIHPFISYAIKGAVWYQGESNRHEAALYEKLFPAMIKNWRDDWQQGDFPFYFVQITPYQYDETRVGAMIRDAQRKSLKVKNTGMAVTLDIVDNTKNSHPRNKLDVGKRLALWALAKDYGKAELVYSGPLYKSIQVEKKKIRVYFEHVGSGLMAKDGDLTHFEIAGNDKIFYPASAIIDGETVVLESDKVKKPVAVRFAFYNTDEPNFFNREGLPASTFRTDNWQISTEHIKDEE